MGIFLYFTATQEFVVNDYFYFFHCRQKFDVWVHPNPAVGT